MPIIQTMLGGASGKYWVLDIAGDTVNSDVTDMFSTDGLVLDGSDNIYFTCSALEEPGNFTNRAWYSILFKVDKNGQLQLQKEIGSSNSDIVQIRTASNTGRALDIDSDGYLYGSFVTKPSQSIASDSDGYIVMFDTAGNADTGVASDINYQVFNGEVAVRSDDYVYHLIGNKEFSGAVTEPYLIYHFNRTFPSGTLYILDQIRLNDYNGVDLGNSKLAIDSSDNAIIAGKYEYNPSNNDFYIWIQKFGTPSSFLSRVWDKHIYSTEPSKTTDFHNLIGLTTDSSDNIYLLCTITYDSTGYKAGFIKLNSSGVIQWARQFDGTVTGSPNDYIYWEAAVVNSNGDLYACSGTGSSGLALLKYNSSGTLQWVRNINTGDVSNGLDYPRIKLDSNEDLIIGAQRTDLNGDKHTIIIKMPSDGSLIGTYGNFVFSSFTDWTDEVCNVTTADSPLTTTSTGPSMSYKTPTTTNSNYTTSITLV